MQHGDIPTTSRKISDTPSIGRRLTRVRVITAKDLRGFFVPVLACFNDDEFMTLNLSDIEKYAAWLKREKMQGVCVNSITGEGPALGYTERRLLVEAWWKWASKFDLILIVQVGGAPLPDVLQLAEHADNLGVHAVLCLPELFYKPNTIEELVGYCKIVAKKCSSCLFLYYHMPELTGINFDMSIFCNMAQKSIPNFIGIFFASNDLEIGSKCLRENRVVLLGSSLLIAGASLLGFDAFMCSCLNVRPDLARAIVVAMNANNLTLARERQQHLDELIRYCLTKCETGQWVDAMKYWFNAEYRIERGPGFLAGAARKFSLKKSI